MSCVIVLDGRERSAARRISRPRDIWRELRPCGPESEYPGGQPVTFLTKARPIKWALSRSGKRFNTVFTTPFVNRVRFE